MAGNTVTLTIAGDADQLQQAARRAEQATAEVASAAQEAGGEMATSAAGASRMETGMANVANIAAGMSTALGDAGAAVSAISDLQNHSATEARQYQRAIGAVEQAQIDQKQAAIDLRQATLDLNQSYIDGKQAQVDVEQAQIDARQALLDAGEAQKAYNDAVKEHGAGSSEARQAAIDLSQAQTDLKQANVDAEQAQADLAQSQADGEQATNDQAQAARSAKDATLDLAEAQSEASSFSGLAGFGRDIEALTPAILGVVAATNLYAMAQTALAGTTIRATAAQAAAKVATIASSVASGIASAAQWVWNLSLFASPITWIVLGVMALVAVIVLIATKTTWFQTLWDIVWAGIKATIDWFAASFRVIWDGILLYLETAKAVWKAIFDAIVGYIMWVVGNYRAAWDAIVAGGRWVLEKIGDLRDKLWAVFRAIGSGIAGPFRSAFNMIADAWNNTVGSLRWTIPAWVPIVGGKSVSAPRLPRFHTGGVVPGAAGSEMLAILQAGETVVPASGGGTTDTVVLRGGDAFWDSVLDELARAVGARGGDVQLVLGGRRG